MYRKNFFGDITAIYKGATKVAEYKYDAWGNCTIILNTSGYGSRNPFRYRGYYFDSDLGMYYLTTRYYDPKTGRFINADSIEYLKPDAINGLNLYAYCKNNPMMLVDPIGQNWTKFINYLSGLFGTYTDYSRKIAKIAEIEFLIGKYEEGIVDTNISGNDSAPISFFTKVPDEWWKFWDYQIGRKTTIGDYSQSYSFGIGESNYSISLGNSSIDFTIGLMETGIGTSHSVDDITYYNQLYIRPIVILIAVVFVKYVIPAVSSSGVFIPLPV